MGECICKSCPSWLDCGNGSMGFCFEAVGKSKCITKEKGCICGACPVQIKLKQLHYYYCTKGSEKAQAGK